MDRIVTIAERKARALKRRKDDVDAVIGDLRDYAARKGGRFMVFGSAAKGLLREDSDLDVLVDFPPEDEREAFEFLELACLGRNVPCDAQYMPRHETAFLQRVRKHAIVLP